MSKVTKENPIKVIDKRGQHSMYGKALVVILFCLSVAIFAETLWSSNADSGGSQTPSLGQEKEDPTTLKARVKKAKANGATKVTFDSPVPIYAETSGLDEASSTYLIVVAKSIEGKTLMLSPHKLTTFQKFEIVERFGEPPNTGCCGPEASDLPSELVSPGTNELYVRINGGEQIIDGVEVTQKKEFQFKDGEQYLLFLLPDTTGVISTIPLGPYGVFKVKDDTVESLMNYRHTLDTEITTNYGKSLTLLKATIRRRNRRKGMPTEEGTPLLAHPYKPLARRTGRYR
jgi:hypothetical protein